MLPSQLPTIDAFFSIAVCLGVDVKRYWIISANNTGDDLVLYINTRLICEVSKDVFTNLSITWLRAILSLQCRGCFLVEWAKAGAR